MPVGGYLNTCRAGDVSNINCSDSNFTNRDWIQTCPSQHRFDPGIILEEITGPQASEWGIEHLKRCLNGIVANEMRNVREPLGLVTREVSDVLNLCFPSYGHCKESLWKIRPSSRRAMVAVIFIRDPINLMPKLFI